TGASSCDFVFFSSRRRHTRLQGDWSSDVCSRSPRVAREGGQHAIGEGRRFAAQLVGEVARQQRDVLATVPQRRKRDLHNGETKEIGRASCREGEEKRGDAGGVV